MPKFTFIHAADLHLGAPFRGLDAAAAAEAGGNLGSLMAEAGYEALARLEEACLTHGAEFLILSGDIYDDKDGVLRARFALRDMFLRLQKAGVRVFIAHGNHDPRQEGTLPVAWPVNVTVFGISPETGHIARDGRTIALIQGISHAGPREKENLALRFRRFAPGTAETEVDGDSPFAGLPPDVPADVFQIAVLHCAVGGAGEGHAPYAPCALGDLTGAGFEYWALGHVHQGRVLSREPLVVYPGSMQGLHINETGAHGCCVVHVDESDCTVRHLPLAPVVWEKILVDIAPGGGFADEDSRITPETVDSLEECIVKILDQAVEDIAADVQTAFPPGNKHGGAALRALFCRLVLRGAAELDAVLRRPGSLDTLLERLRAEFAAVRPYDGGGSVRVWVKDIALETSPLRDFAALAERNDLIGEIAKLADAAQDDASSSDLVNRAVAPLYGHHRLKKILGAASAENREEARPESPAALAASAKSLLCALLEDE